MCDLAMLRGTFALNLLLSARTLLDKKTGNILGTWRLCHATQVSGKKRRTTCQLIAVFSAFLVLRMHHRIDRESSYRVLYRYVKRDVLHAQFSSGLQWGDLTKPSAPHVACIWIWITINFHVMDSGKLIVVQLQIHARNLSIRTNYALRRPVELAKEVPGTK